MPATSPRAAQWPWQLPFASDLSMTGKVMMWVDDGEWEIIVVDLAGELVLTVRTNTRESAVGKFFQLLQRFNYVGLASPRMRGIIEHVRRPARRPRFRYVHDTNARTISTCLGTVAQED